MNRPAEGLYPGDRIKIAGVFIAGLPYSLKETLLNVRVKEIKTLEDGAKEIWFEREYHGESSF